jgi:hypothetical protein
VQKHLRKGTNNFIAAVASWRGVRGLSARFYFFSEQRHT